MEEAAVDIKQPKIEVNDKTVFAEGGLPLSPKEVTLDTPSVKEGLLRLRRACQLNFVRLDHVENFLFGKDYRPEKKITIAFTKEAIMAKLDMGESHALDFARYLIEQGGSTITTSGDVGCGENGVVVDQQRSTLACRVVMHLMGQI